MSNRSKGVIIKTTPDNKREKIGTDYYIDQIMNMSGITVGGSKRRCGQGLTQEEVDRLVRRQTTEPNGYSIKIISS